MSVQLVGILNYTPDSFFDGGKNFDSTAALQSAQQLLNMGADFIDIGAEATNPFVSPITSKDEIKRLTLVLPALFKKFPGKISLDTYHAKTLEWALQFGAPILNDVSGLHDPQIVQLAAAHDLACIVGHLPPEAEGIPVKAHAFKMDNLALVVKQILTRAEELQKASIKKHNIILDPNIGFGKSMKLNWQLLEFAKYVPDYKVTIGHSNKRFLGCDAKTGKLLENGQEIRYTSERNLEAAQLAVDSGLVYLRVHDPVVYRMLASC